MYERENCSAARTLELVGERWSLLIIRNAAFGGMSRFSEFERRLGIAPNILAKRLDDFISAGLMQLRPAAESASRSYVLTQKGHELARVIMALTEWGDRWSAPDGPPIIYQHNSCGGSVHLTVACARCGAEPEVAEIIATPGPGANADQRASLA